MKVALIGVPKTGKSKFAKEWRPQDKLKVVDNIAQKYSKATGLQIGVEADHRVNAALALERWSLEYKHRHVNTIFTTTVLDSIFYSLTGMAEFEIRDKQPSPEDIFKSPYYFTNLWLLSLFRNSWTFDKTFFLPYKGKDEVWKIREETFLTIFDNYGIAYETVDL